MLAGKIAIVTGGGSGIGAASAELLAKNGAHVIVASELSVQKMQPVVDRIKEAGGSAEVATCDVTDRAMILQLFAAAERNHGKVDIVVQSAGVLCTGAIEDMPGEAVETMFAVNAIGPISVMQAAIPIMRRCGGGAIVNIASCAAVIGVQEAAVYSATKAALAHFTRTMAPELRRSGIRVNSVGPGPVATPMLGFTGVELTPEQKEGMKRREARSISPYGNAMMAPDDIAQVVLFLVSDAGRALQGAFVVADQGMSSGILPPAS